MQRILVARNPGAMHASSPEELMRQEGLQPLAERERHILPLLDKDLTNESAPDLLVTPGTVKVPTSNLSRQLGVTDRRAALTLAKAFGLLAADQI